MTLRQYLSIMVFATVLGWVAFIFVMFNVDPFLDSGSGFLFFFMTLGFALTGTFSTIIYMLHTFFSKKIIATFRIVQKSFLYGASVAIASVLLLFLQGKGIMNLWNTLIFLGILLFLFLFKLSLHFAHKRQAPIEII
jgi:hypothetical protein